MEQEGAHVDSLLVFIATLFIGWCDFRVYESVYGSIMEVKRTNSIDSELETRASAWNFGAIYYIDSMTVWCLHSIMQGLWTEAAKTSSQNILATGGFIVLQTGSNTRPTLLPCSNKKNVFIYIFLKWIANHYLIGSTCYSLRDGNGSWTRFTSVLHWALQVLFWIIHVLTICQRWLNHMEVCYNWTLIKNTTS